MAFKKVVTRTEAIQIKKGVVVTGHWFGVRRFQKQFGKTTRDNYVYSFATKDGQVDVWGNGAINHALMPDGSQNPALWGRFVRLTGGKKLKIRGQANPMQAVDVEVDDSVKPYTDLKADLSGGVKKGGKKVKKTLAKRLKKQ